MVLLHSEKMLLGTPAKDFSLPGVDGKTYSLKSFPDKKALIVLFICNHCPYVQAIEDRIISLQRDYAEKGVQLVGICSNDPTDYPDDRPESLKNAGRKKTTAFLTLLMKARKLRNPMAQSARRIFLFLIRTADWLITDKWIIAGKSRQKSRGRI